MINEPNEHGAVMLKLINFLDQDLEFVFDTNRKRHGSPRQASPNAGRAKRPVGEETAARRRATSARNRFASYLVSIVTHPIGLGASLSPYNCSVESMLAYLMDMLKFTEKQLKRVLVRGQLDIDSQRDKDKDNGETKTPANSAVFKKFHAWKPELRLRINPPPLFQHLTGSDTDRINSFTVRVYLFKIRDRRQQQMVADGQRRKSPVAEQNKKSELNSPSSAAPKSADTFLDVLKSSQQNLLTLPRPQKDLRAEIKYVRRSADGQDTFRMVRTKSGAFPTHQKDDNKSAESDSASGHLVDEDIRLNIRRYYCDSKALYILKLEFWLDKSSSGFSSWLNLSRLVGRRANLSSCCLAANSKRQMSSPSSRNQHIFGYTSLRLSQIPSYAIKSSYPVWSMHEKRVGCCELSMEFRNRHLLAARDNKNDSDDQLDASQIRREFITNHMRLYTLCIAHQLSLLANDDHLDPTSILERSHSTAPTLDDLMFVPAFSIINQHRLQSNLSQQEDHSLRRSAMLLLLARLEQNPPPSKNKPTLDLCKLLLISMAQHEFLSANCQFNNTTRQEMDPFKNHPLDNSQDIITILEHETIQELAQKFVSAERLKVWLSRAADQPDDPSDSYDKKLVVLASLRLVKNIIMHYENNLFVSPRLAILTGNIELKVDQALSSTLVNEIKLRIDKILSNDEQRFKPPLTTPMVTLPDKPARQRYPGTRISNRSSTNPWQKLLSDIQIIENDIMLHWNEKGLASLKLAESEMIEKQENEQNDKLKSVIQEKMRDYLLPTKV